MLLWWNVSWQHRFNIEMTEWRRLGATLSVTLPPSLYAVVQSKRMLATGTRDGNKWLEAESQQGPFVVTILSNMEAHLQLFCLCLKLLSLLNIVIQILCPHFLIHTGIHSGFARRLEESGETCQFLSPCSPSKKLDLSVMSKKLTA